MSSKPASSLSSIFEFCWSSESDHQIVDRGHDFSHIAHGHSSGIFMEGHVAAAVQSGFNAPVRTANLYETSRCSVRASQAGDAQFDFIRSAITASRAPPLELTFKAIDLSQARPGGIRIEHLARSHNARFNPPVSFIDFLCGEKIHLDFSETRLWIFRSKELLNVLIQPELIFFDRKNVVTALVDNLSGEGFLSVHGISGDHFL